LSHQRVLLSSGLPAATLGNRRKENQSVEYGIFLPLNYGAFKKRRLAGFSAAFF
jgi:hypothetical protein